MSILYITVLVFIIFLIYQIFKNPYKFPYFTYDFNISGQRNPDILDCIDKFIIDGKFDLVIQHYNQTKKWKFDNVMDISKIIIKPFKSYRMKQLISSFDEENEFVFIMSRTQTRYQQTNYVKSSYKVSQTIKKESFSYVFLEERNKQLSEINYECTLNSFNSQEQRKQMTKLLKEQIKIRDNYTCQRCGKYMPDSFGLHIDHIVPVSKGGKSVPSNLQVLCYQCNLRKSDKLLY